MERKKQYLTVEDYPRMTAMKSKWNGVRQTLMNGVAQWLQRKQSSSTENPFLEGIFAPCEECVISEFKVQGEIPKQLSGIFLRIGPNPIELDPSNLHHWFSGDGMIHGLKIEQGQVKWFKSQYIATDTVQKFKKLPKIDGFRRGPSDTVNTNAFFFANKIWAMIEAGTFPVCLDLELNSERYQLFNTDADLPFTAHPHQDPVTGFLHAICYDALDTENAYYEVFDKDGKLLHLAMIAVDHGPMIHDCAITQKEILVFDFPVTFSRTQFLKGNSLPYEWNEQHPARIGILPFYGRGGEVRWINIGADVFVFHSANAYRDDKQNIILDIVVHDRMFDHSKQGPFEQQKTHLERWVIDAKTCLLERKILDEQTQEFPRIDERFIGRSYQYLYSVSFDAVEMSKANSLFVHDLYSQKKKSYSFGDQWISSEVIFIPESKYSEEGRGYLLSYVHHLDLQSSKVVILKVNGLDIQPQAEIDLGVRVPMGFHANWVELQS